MTITQEVKGRKPEYDVERSLTFSSVEDRFIGLFVTESTGPLNWSRRGIELHNVEEIKELRDFLTEMIEKMSK